MDRGAAARLLDRLNELNRTPGGGVNAETRSWVVAQLEGGPLVAHTARRTMLKRLLIPAEAESWMQDGFSWAIESAACAGMDEWVCLCNQVLKLKRSKAHPERSSGSSSHASKPELPEASARCCLDLSVSHFGRMWRALASFQEQRVDTLSLGRLQLGLVSLAGRCSKEILRATSDTMICWFSDTEDNGDEVTTTVHLHLPPLSTLLDDGRTPIEVRLKVMDVLLATLRSPERITNILDCCRSLLVILDRAVASAFDHVESGMGNMSSATKRSHECAFMNDSGMHWQISQRSILLWVCAIRSIASIRGDGGSKAAGSDASSLAALGPNGLGRRGAANLLCELLADDDQELLDALLALTLMYQEAEILGASQRQALEVRLPGSGGGRWAAVEALLRGELHPRALFAAFAGLICFDERVVLDMVLSSETRALEYLLRVLRLPASRNHAAHHGMDKAEDMLKRLHAAIVRLHRHGMVAFNPEALLARFRAYFAGQLP